MKLAKHFSTEETSGNLAQGCSSGALVDFEKNVLDILQRGRGRVENHSVVSFILELGSRQQNPVTLLHI